MQRKHCALLVASLLAMVFAFDWSASEADGVLSDQQMDSIYGAGCREDYCTGCWLKNLATPTCVGQDDCGCKDGPVAACPAESVDYHAPTVERYDPSLNTGEPETGPDNDLVLATAPVICRIRYECTAGVLKLNEGCLDFHGHGIKLCNPDPYPDGTTPLGECRTCTRSTLIETVRVDHDSCITCAEHCP